MTQNQLAYQQNLIKGREAETARQKMQYEHADRMASNFETARANTEKERSNKATENLRFKEMQMQDAANYAQYGTVKYTPQTSNHLDWKNENENEKYGKLADIWERIVGGVFSPFKGVKL